jgi:hypothetical protein
MKSLTESLRHGTIALRKLGPSYGTGTGHKYTRYWNLRTGTVARLHGLRKLGPSYGTGTLDGPHGALRRR